MLGLMQNQPLLLSSILQHAQRFHGDTEIVSRTPEGTHRQTYSDASQRIKKLADALRRSGIIMGDRVATLAWNGYRHFEVQYAAYGIGAVWHAINPRLIKNQISYIINHAEDQVIFLDKSFLPIISEMKADIPTVRLFVLMGDEKDMPSPAIPNMVCYETFLATGNDAFEWPVFDELSASSLFYTSGTTGNPKGVLYSHRSDVLHCLSALSAACMGITALDNVMPMTPMFHANSAWGFTHCAPMSGAKLVLPGQQLDPVSIADLIDAESVTVMAGVPVLYGKLLDYYQATGRKPGTLNRFVVAGSMPPPRMIEGYEALGVTVDHLWGMTETSPTGTLPRPSRKTAGLSRAEQIQRKSSQGRPIYGVDVKIADAAGNELPRDGQTSGRFMVRGPWITSGYYRDDRKVLEDGWFDTGDLAVMDDDNHVKLTDRAKDVIKSGGEWISSIDVENLTAGCPGVAEAAVIGIPHPKWDERPLLVVVPTAEEPATARSIYEFLDGKIAKWWMPDDIVFVSALVYGATGKVQKMELRQRFHEHYSAGTAKAAGAAKA